LIGTSQSLSLNINQEKYKEEQGKRTFYALKYMQNTVNFIPYQVNVVNDEIGQEREFGEPANEVVKVPTLGALSCYELLN